MYATFARVRALGLTFLTHRSSFGKHSASQHLFRLMASNISVRLPSGGCKGCMEIVVDISYTDRKAYWSNWREVDWSGRPTSMDRAARPQFFDKPLPQPPHQSLALPDFPSISSGRGNLPVGSAYVSWPFPPPSLPKHYWPFLPPPSRYLAPEPCHTRSGSHA